MNKSSTKREDPEHELSQQGGLYDKYFDGLSDMSYDERCNLEAVISKKQEEVTKLNALMEQIKAKSKTKPTPAASSTSTSQPVTPIKNCNTKPSPSKSEKRRKPKSAKYVKEEDTDDEEKEGNGGKESALVKGLFDPELSEPKPDLAKDLHLSEDEGMDLHISNTEKFEDEQTASPRKKLKIDVKESNALLGERNVTECSPKTRSRSRSVSASSYDSRLSSRPSSPTATKTEAIKEKKPGSEPGSEPGGPNHGRQVPTLSIYTKSSNWEARASASIRRLEHDEQLFDVFKLAKPEALETKMCGYYNFNACNYETDKRFPRLTLLAHSDPVTGAPWYHGCSWCYKLTGTIQHHRVTKCPFINLKMI